MRHAPRLEFVYDDTVEGAARLTGLIEKAVAGIAPAPRSLPPMMPPMPAATSRAASRRAPRRMHSGVLLLDKPLGLSSNAALQRVRSLFEREKAGHVGSLDPLATGMLPVCLGRGDQDRRRYPFAGRKCYRFTPPWAARPAPGTPRGQ